jgi:uncharacterized protein YpmB
MGVRLYVPPLLNEVYMNRFSFSRFLINNPLLWINIVVQIVFGFFTWRFFKAQIDNQGTFSFMFSIGIVSELLFQILFGTAKYLWKREDIIKKIGSVIVFMVCLLYLIFYSMVCSVGFYSSELSVKKKQYIDMETQSKERIIEIGDIDYKISVLKVMLANETNTKYYGSRTKDILSNMTVLKIEKDNLGKQNAIETNQEPAYVSITKALSFLNITGEQVIMMMFISVMLLIYVALILSSWNLDGNIKSQKQSKESPTINKTTELKDIETTKKRSFYDLKM